MSATTHAGGAGVVLGVASVLLAQQFNYFDLSAQIPALVAIIVGAFVGGVLFGMVGWALGRRYVRRHPPPETPGQPGST